MGNQCVSDLALQQFHSFAFVGVAPSMVLLYGLSVWAKSALSVTESSSSKSARRKVWYTLR